MNKIFTTNLRVQIGDINYGGHLGHDRLITLLHQARLDFLTQLGGGDCTESACFGVGLIMRRLQVEYLAEAFLRDELCVQMQVKELKGARFVLHYQVLRGKDLIASAETLMAAFDYQRRRVCPLPEVFIQALQSKGM